MKRICIYCKTEFEAQRKDKHYCNPSCRQQAYMVRKGIAITGTNTSIHQNTLIDMTQLSEELQNLNIPPVIINDVSPNTEQNVKTSNDASQNIIIKNDVLDQFLENEKEKQIKTENEVLPEIGKEGKQMEKQEEKHYKPMQSDFLVKLTDFLIRRNYDYELHVCTRENKASLNGIDWINIRFRCLVESLLTLSERKNILLDDLKEITNAFTFILISEYYKLLPENYPYIRTIKNLRNKLRNICIENETAEEISLKFSKELKIKLIALRCELRTVAMKRSFNELEFNEPKNKKPCKTNHHPEEKPQLKLWQINYQKTKREAGKQKH